ncbi:MAG: (d)CMP kinase [Anaerolineales bacterium]|nr:(d)CMP kinase [Anaerolineales bacterium]
MSKSAVIAIDGPAASGKSTVAERIAKELKFLYFDTGVMYRAVTLAVLNANIDPENEAEVSALAGKIGIDVQPPHKNDGRQYDVLLDGSDVTWAIRAARVNRNVSLISTYKGVREAMTSQQRLIGLHKNVVMVGRDIGTVVLPEADIKFYLDASVEERARRRFSEEQKRGVQVDLDQLINAMKERDRIDSTREIAPLRPAADAVILDTTDKNIEEVVTEVLAVIHTRLELSGM